MAQWIQANGTTQEVTPAHGESFTLQEMTRYVGGYLEAIKLDDVNIMYLNEQGILLQKPYNIEATRMVRNARKEHRNTVIVGDVLVATLHETGDDEV